MDMSNMQQTALSPDDVMHSSSGNKTVLVSRYSDVS